jgi:hypothetical protein
MFSDLAVWAIELLKLESVWTAVALLVLDCTTASEVEDILFDAGYAEVLIDDLY